MGVVITRDDIIAYAEVDYIMSNNFAFGGINTSLIFKRFS